MTDASELEPIDEVVARFFGAFDNRNGRTPTLESIAALFAPGAIIVRDAGETCESWSVTAFAQPRVELLTSGRLVDFHEWETDTTTRALGCVAERDCRYEKAGVLDGEPYAGGGRKLIHLGRFADGWRITAIAWSDEA
jgi:hypothetical protein